MHRGIREIFMVAVAATTFDIDSTIFGITMRGWVGFGESNMVIRALYPVLGIFAPVAYLPVEALGFVSVAYCVFFFAVALRMVWNRGVPAQVPRIVYLIALFPLFPAVGNTLFALRVFG